MEGGEERGTQRGKREKEGEMKGGGGVNTSFSPAISFRVLWSDYKKKEEK